MTDNREAKPTSAEMAGLESFFEAARGMPAAPPDADFMARVFSDADAAQPIPPRPGDRVRKSGAARIGLLGLLGGWKGAAGLCTATLAGVWIGTSPPQAIASTAEIVLGTSSSYVIDLDPAAGYIGGEGAL